MYTQNLNDNCKVKLIHGLGTVHTWHHDTHDDLTSFKEALNKLILEEDNHLSKWLPSDQKYYIAISHAPSQPNETQWLKELGFKQLEMGDGLVLSSMDYFTWQQLR